VSFLQYWNLISGLKSLYHLNHVSTTFCFQLFFWWGPTLFAQNWLQTVILRPPPPMKLVLKKYVITSYLLFEQDLANLYAWTGLELQSSYIYPPTAEITGVHQHAQLVFGNKVSLTFLPGCLKLWFSYLHLPIIVLKMGCPFSTVQRWSEGARPLHWGDDQLDIDAPGSGIKQLPLLSLWRKAIPREEVIWEQSTFHTSGKNGT
jgi:hypothetical protein